MLRMGGRLRNARAWIGSALPRWLSLVLGVVAVAIGVFLVLRPFSSLTVLAVFVGVGALVAGIGDLVDAQLAPRPWLRRMAGIAWCVAGLLALLWPGITIGVLAVIVGVLLVVTGFADIVSGVRGSTDQRLAAVIGGLAGVIAGPLALAWPDVPCWSSRSSSGSGWCCSALDAALAARQLDTVDLQDRTAVWGHSQGGHAALWTGALAQTYAPDVDVIGVAALAPASDLIGLVGNLSNISAERSSLHTSSTATPVRTRR